MPERIKAYVFTPIVDDEYGLPLRIEREAEFPLEIALDPCDECGNDRARGDKGRVVYCGACGKEWYPGERAYPKRFRRIRRGSISKYKRGNPSLRS